MLIHVKHSAASQFLLEAETTILFGDLIKIACETHNSRLRLIALLKKLASNAITENTPKDLIKICFEAAEAVSLNQLQAKVFHLDPWKGPFL